MNTCTDASTHSNQRVSPKRDNWNIHTGYTGVHMLACNYAKRVEQTRGVRWTWIHVLMDVHI